MTELFTYTPGVGGLVWEPDAQLVRGWCTNIVEGVLLCVATHCTQRARTL